MSELKNILEFDAVEDTGMDDGKSSMFVLWNEEWRGDVVRSSLSVVETSRQRKRLDVCLLTTERFFSHPDSR